MRMFPREGEQKNLEQDWIRKAKDSEKVNEQLWSFDREKKQEKLQLLMSNKKRNHLFFIRNLPKPAK